MRSRHWGHKPLCRVAFSVPTIGASSPFLSGAQRSCFCASAALQRLLRICCIAAASVHLLHCSVFCVSAASQRLLRSGKLFRSDFRFAPSPRSASASNIFPMALRRSAPGQQHLPDGSPPQRPQASNKPHLAEKSTPVWLAIWRTWAGFANSQHRDAAFATPNNICAHSSLLLHWAAAQTDANLSTHLHRLPTPPPYLRQMRLSPGRVRGCWVLDETFASQGLRCWVANDAASCPCRSSCKSPRARILVLGTSGAHWPARWPRFELTERVAKS